MLALSSIPEPRHESPSRAAVRPHPVQVVGVEVPEDGPGAGGAAGGEAGAVVGRREVELRERGTNSSIQNGCSYGPTQRVVLACFNFRFPAEKKEKCTHYNVWKHMSCMIKMLGRSICTYLDRLAIFEVYKKIPFPKKSEEHMLTTWLGLQHMTFKLQ